MIDVLSLLNALIERGVTIEVDGSRVHQRGGPPLSQAAIEQLSRYAGDLSAAADASPFPESGSVHGVLATDDLIGFVNSITSAPLVSVSRVSDAIAVSPDGHHVEVIAGGSQPEARTKAVGLALELETVGWGANGLSTSRDLSVAVSVLTQAGALQGSITTPGDALAAARGEPIGSVPTTDLGRLVYETRAVHDLASIVDRQVHDLGLGRVVALEERVARILRQTTEEGVQVDRQNLEALVAHAEGTFEYHEARVRHVLGVGINSPELLVRLEVHGCSTASLKSVDLEPLREQHAVVDDILRARTARGMLTNFGRPWLTAVRTSADGRAHPTFKGNGETGRISSTSPNVMGVPRDARARACIIASEGHSLVEADYSASQLRIVAAYCRVEMLRELFERDADLHAWTASKYFRTTPELITATQRAFGKVANFAPLYGAGDDRILEIARSDYNAFLHAHEVEELVHIFFAAFPEIAKWHEVEFATPTPVAVTPLGRRLWLARPGTTFNSRLAAPIQAIEADAIKTAIVAAEPEIRARGGRLLSPVNDALLFEIPDDQVADLVPVLKAAMTEAMIAAMPPPAVPVKVDVKAGKHWGAMRQLE